MRNFCESLSDIMITIKVVFKISVFYFPLNLTCLSNTLEDFFLKKVLRKFAQIYGIHCPFVGFYFVFLKSPVFMLAEFLGFCSDYS